MPKIIENAREKIIDSGREMLVNRGYSRFSVRLLAENANVATGTVYNYFEDKTDLISTIIYEDWNNVNKRLENNLLSVTTLRDGVRMIYDEMYHFSHMYYEVWVEYSNRRSKEKIVEDKHNIVSKEISYSLNSLLSRFALKEGKEDERIVKTLSELIIIGSVYDNIDYASIEALIDRLY